MKTTFSTIPFILAISLFFSFQSTNRSKEFIGTYGVAENDPSNIRLQLYTSNTFDYQDHSDITNKINVSGKWIQNGNTVRLQVTDENLTFHSKWIFKKNGAKAVARKGMTWYTLHKIHRVF